MKALHYRSYGDITRLSLGELPEPRPSGGPLVAVEVAALNPKDALFRKGKFALLSGRSFPKQCGLDFAGTVTRAGGGMREGDRVFGALNEWTFRRGTLAEFVAPKAHEVALLPSGVDPAHAASVALVGLTALQALRDVARVKPGQRVLINGASGGVGTVAIQLARLLGAEVTTVSSAETASMCRALGAQETLDYAAFAGGQVGARSSRLGERIRSERGAHAERRDDGGASAGRGGDGGERDVASKDGAHVGPGDDGGAARREGDGEERDVASKEGARAGRGVDGGAERCSTASTTGAKAGRGGDGGEERDVASKEGAHVGRGDEGGAARRGGDGGEQRDVASKGGAHVGRGDDGGTAGEQRDVAGGEGAQVGRGDDGGAAQRSSASTTGANAACGDADAQRDGNADSVRDRVRRFDVVFDVFGNLRFVDARKLLEERGVFISTVPSAGRLVRDVLTRLSKQQERLVVVQPRRVDLEQLGAWLADGSLRAVIDGRYPLADFASAFAKLELKHAHGKLIIDVAHRLFPEGG